MTLLICNLHYRDMVKISLTCPRLPTMRIYGHTTQQSSAYDPKLYDVKQRRLSKVVHLHRIDGWVSAKRQDIRFIDFTRTVAVRAQGSCIVAEGAPVF